MDRRYFLQGCGGLFLGGLLTGCQRTDVPLIEAYLLRRALPIQLLRRFRSNAQRSNAEQRPSLKIRTKDSLPALYAQLQLWADEKSSRQIRDSGKRSDNNERLTSPPPHIRLLSLGDYWMLQAIQNKLIWPLSSQISGWKNVPEPWRALGRRNDQGQLDSQGQYWGAPYRWGATVLVYRKDKLRSRGIPLRDWSDLWRPELSQRLSLLNQPREVIGLTLKSLGKSYNEADPTSVSNLRQQLQSLHQQARFYSSRNYIQPLLLGDTWVAMGWSTDVLAAIAQNSNLGIVFPQSGSALWADFWVHAQQMPQDLNRETPWVEKWVNYWWSPEVAHDLSQFTTAISTIPSPSASSQHQLSTLEQRLAASSNGQTGLAERLQRSEPILPLATQSLSVYQQLWTETRLS